MAYVEQLSIGDKVMLTSVGAKSHRIHHTKNAVVGAAVATAVAAPAVIGAGIGVAVAGTAVGVSTGAAGAAIGGAAGAATSAFNGFPEGGLTGQIVKKEKRWWGVSGHDYEVHWEDGSTGWHLSKHLMRV
jgi:hypothetical protein